jgi:predicted anti-sigma-YlaC factor YlaD
MRCQPCREALSAELDGEPSPVPAAVVERHLAGCASCRAFAGAGASLRRRTAVRPADPVPDLTGPILAAARGRTTASAVRPADHWTRWALLGVALTQLAVALPPMLLGHDAGAPVHLARELGAWDLALAAALLLVVLRPARALGLVPFAGALAVAMVLGAGIDVASGRAALGSEAQHLLDLVGLVLLWLLARHPVDGAPLLGGLRRHGPALAA